MVKLSSDFYKDKHQSSGIHPHCKSCHNERRRMWQQQNRKKLIEYVKKNKELHPEKYSKLKVERNRKYILANPTRHNVRRLAWFKMKKGILVPDSCCVCKTLYKKEVKAQMHHNDYSKPLEIIWMCPTHHKAWHRVFIAEG